VAGGAQGLGLESSGSLLGKGVRTLDSSQCNPPPQSEVLQNYYSTGGNRGTVSKDQNLASESTAC
jgi:hypothetical protein